MNKKVLILSYKWQGYGGSKLWKVILIFICESSYSDSMLNLIYNVKTYPDKDVCQNGK